MSLTGRREHLRAVVWPKGPLTKGSKTNYRYVVIGMLVTDRPLEGFEGQNEVVLDSATSIAEALTAMPRKRNVGPVFGDAVDVLLGLNRLKTKPLQAVKPKKKA